jgi:hypothetical protein
VVRQLAGHGGTRRRPGGARLVADAVRLASRQAIACTPPMAAARGPGAGGGAPRPPMAMAGGWKLRGEKRLGFGIV